MKAISYVLTLVLIIMVMGCSGTKTYTVSEVENILDGTWHSSSGVNDTLSLAQSEHSFVLSVPSQGNIEGSGTYQVSTPNNIKLNMNEATRDGEAIDGVDFIEMKLDIVSDSEISVLVQVQQKVIFQGAMKKTSE